NEVERIAPLNLHASPAPRPPARDELLAVPSLHGHVEVVAQFPVTTLEARKGEVEDWEVELLRRLVHDIEALASTLHDQDRRPINNGEDLFPHLATGG